MDLKKNINNYEFNLYFTFIKILVIHYTYVKVKIKY